MYLRGGAVGVSQLRVSHGSDQEIKDAEKQDSTPNSIRAKEADLSPSSQLVFHSTSQVKKKKVYISSTSHFTHRDKK